MEKITSRSNGLLVHMKKLAASAAYRREQGVYLCDSPKLVEEALLQKRSIREYHLAEANLARAINRLRVKSRSANN